MRMMVIFNKMLRSQSLSGQMFELLLLVNRFLFLLFVLLFVLLMVLKIGNLLRDEEKRIGTKGGSFGGEDWVGDVCRVRGCS